MPYMSPWANRRNIQGIWNYLLCYGLSYSLSSHSQLDVAGALKSPSNSVAKLKLHLEQKQHGWTIRTGGKRRDLDKTRYHASIICTEQKKGPGAFFLNCVQLACQYWLKNPAAEKSHVCIHRWRGSHPLCFLSPGWISLSFLGQIIIKIVSLLGYL